MEENLTRSIEDYLEAIYVFELKGENNIPSLMVAKTLNVSKAAVAKAMNRLHDEGYILKELYGQISLTEKGREIARLVYDKHKTIKEFLIKIGVSEKNAEIDCCKIEHIVCSETLSKIKEFNKNH